MPIQLKTVSFSFSEFSGGLNKKTQTTSFNFVPERVYCAIKSFDIKFCNGEHKFLRQVVTSNISIIYNKENPPKPTIGAQVTVEFGVRDDSGDWDDKYDGYVDVLVVAEKEDNPALLYSLIEWGDAIGLVAANNLHLSVKPDQKLRADHQLQGDDETFRIEILDNVGGYLCNRTLVAIRASNGQYLCAEGGGSQEIIANRSAVGIWETFTMLKITSGSAPTDFITNEDKVAFRASNGQFLCAENAGAANLIANRSSVSDWEIFTIKRF